MARERERKNPEDRKPRIVIENGTETIKQVHRLLELLARIPNAGKNKTSHEELAKSLDLEMGRFRAIWAYRSETRPQISIHEITQILDHARAIVARSGDGLDEDDAHEIVAQCFTISKALIDATGVGGRTFREFAFYRFLGFDAGTQDRFSAAHAGMYLLMYLGRDKRLRVAELEIAAKQPGEYLCRFSTRHIGEDGTEDLKDQIAEGYIYQADPTGDLIYAIGPTVENVLRYTILRCYPGTKGRRARDLEGLRLFYQKKTDVLAHRQYCRFLEPGYDKATLGRLLKAISSDDDKAALKAFVPDLDWIIEHLAAEDAEFPRFAGLTIPQR